MQCHVMSYCVIVGHAMLWCDALCLELCLYHVMIWDVYTRLHACCIPTRQSAPAVGAALRGGICLNCRCSSLLIVRCIGLHYVYLISLLVFPPFVFMLYFLFVLRSAKAIGETRRVLSDVPSEHARVPQTSCDLKAHRTSICLPLFRHTCISLCGKMEGETMKINDPQNPPPQCTCPLRCPRYHRAAL